MLLKNIHFHYIQRDWSKNPHKKIIRMTFSVHPDDFFILSQRNFSFVSTLADCIAAPGFCLK